MKQIILTWLAFGVAVAMAAVPAFAETCKPTEPDMLGPMYKPDAPVRSAVGKGYVLSGAVKSSTDCSPVKGAKIEFWLAGPDKGYDDEHRATMFSDASGAYRFESNFPPGYFGRPPHIHVKVSAPGFKTLVTQHYPEKGHTQAVFDLVLVPER
jgi:protocatechuate 3,4-dioxygenase beta subunit